MNEIMSPWGNFFPSEVSNVVVRYLSYQVRPKSGAIPRISSPPKKIRGVHHTDGQLLITMGQLGQRGAHSRRMRNPLYSDKRRKPKKQQRRNIPATASHAPPGGGTCPCESGGPSLPPRSVPQPGLQWEGVWCAGRGSPAAP